MLVYIVVEHLGGEWYITTDVNACVPALSTIEDVNNGMEYFHTSKNKAEETRAKVRQFAEKVEILCFEV